MNEPKLETDDVTDVQALREQVLAELERCSVAPSSDSPDHAQRMLDQAMAKAAKKRERDEWRRQARGGRARWSPPA